MIWIYLLIGITFPHIVIGANSSLTAAVVVVTGLVGANFVQVMLDKLRFQDPIARGIATASRCAHFLKMAYIWIYVVSISRYICYLWQLFHHLLFDTQQSCNLWMKNQLSSRNQIGFQKITFKLTHSLVVLQCSWIGNSSIVSKGTRGTPILCHCLCSYRYLCFSRLLSSCGQAKPARHSWLKRSAL